MREMLHHGFGQSYGLLKGEDSLMLLLTVCPSIYVGSGINRLCVEQRLVTKRCFTCELTSCIGWARVWPQPQQVQRDGINKAGKEWGNKKDLPLLAVASCQTSLAVVFNFKNCVQKFCLKRQVSNSRFFSTEFKFRIKFKFAGGHVSLSSNYSNH